MRAATCSIVNTFICGNDMKLEATELRSGKWCVRPEGQLGTIGWSPQPWSARFVTARSAAAAIEKVIKQGGCK